MYTPTEAWSRCDLRTTDPSLRVFQSHAGRWFDELLTVRDLPLGDMLPLWLVPFPSPSKMFLGKFPFP